MYERSHKGKPQFLTLTEEVKFDYLITKNELRSLFDPTSQKEQRRLNKV